MRLMKEEPSLLLLPIYRGLKICLALLGVVFVVGTIYGVFLRANFENPSGTITSYKIEEGQTFIGIGRLRVSTTDDNPGMVILFVSFIYNPSDKAFSEELALRVQAFRQIIADYLGSFSITELQVLSEDTLKAELLRRFNTILRLGQIEALHFSDFMIIN